MADESVVALLARENKNAVMLLNERRRALKWEERQGLYFIIELFKVVRSALIISTCWANHKSLLKCF